MMGGFQRGVTVGVVVLGLSAVVCAASALAAARDAWRELIKSYPTSRRIPNAYLAFAEHSFGEGQMDAADRFYERVVAFPDSDVYGYALYKRAWVAVLFRLIVLGVVLAAGCSPDYPDDEYHRSEVDSACVSCHFRRVDVRAQPGDSLPEMRPVPDGHKEGENPDEAHAACTRCHDRAD